MVSVSIVEKTVTSLNKVIKIVVFVCIVKQYSGENTDLSQYSETNCGIFQYSGTNSGIHQYIGTNSRLFKSLQ